MLVDCRSRFPQMAAPVQMSGGQLIQAEPDWAGMIIQGTGLFWRGVGIAAIRAMDAILTWHERARSRAQLKQLDQRALNDLGLTHRDVMREIEKPFWR